MSKKMLFLAGPLTGISYKDAFEWRRYVETKLPDDIVAVSALRGKDFLSKETQLRDSYLTHPLTTPRGTITRDRFDVARCDAVLANVLSAKNVSIGTMVELGWADALRKPVIVVIEENNVHAHEFVKEVASYLTDNLDEAIEAAISVLDTTLA